MSPQRKAKKPARINGEIKQSMMPIRDNRGMTIRFEDRPKYLQLPIDNPDALVEQVANDMAAYGRSGQYLLTWEDIARAALRSLGVPIKGGKKP